jgi:hypothetical protein
MAVSLFPKKISTATMGLTTKQLEEVAAAADPKPVSVMRVWGVVSGRQPGVSQFGNYVKFTGEIAAINLVSSEEARSQALLLPSAAETIVSSMFDKASKEGGTAQIALEITVLVNKSAKGGTKFSYGVKPLIEFKGDDALAAMAKTLPAPILIKGLTKK